MNRMLEEVSSRDLAELQAFDQLEPIGDRRLDYLAARVCSAVLMAAPLQDKHSLPGPYELLQNWDTSARLLELLEKEQADSTKAEQATAFAKASQGKAINVYEGDSAPPVKCIGKRAAKIGSKRRAKLDRIFGRREEVEKS